MRGCHFRETQWEFLPKYRSHSFPSLLSLFFSPNICCPLLLFPFSKLVHKRRLVRVIRVPSLARPEPTAAASARVHTFDPVAIFWGRWCCGALGAVDL